MSKKSEKESVKQKETNQENSKKEELKEPLQMENKDTELKKLKEEVANLKKEKLRLLADIENARKDFWRQMEEFQKYSNKKIILWTLNFLVELEERVLKAMHEDSEPKVKIHLTGVEMMKKELWKNLEKEGVKEIKIQPRVDLWDSSFQEISSEVENNELPDWTIVEVKKKGYMLHDQILRPAQVVVSKRSKSKNQNK